MVSSFVVTNVIAADAALVFDLELDTDIHAESMKNSGESAVTSTGSSALKLNDEVTFSGRHLGFTWSMTSKITSYLRPTLFVDEQVRGPFTMFTHEHRFEPIEPGKTLMTDVVTFSLPFGPLGRAASVIAKIYLRHLIEERGAYIATQAQQH